MGPEPSARSGFAGGRFAFDRAADYYDRTRSLEPDVMTAVVELLVSELRGRGTCLEIGVGTGRIGIPVAEQGVDLVGLDLSMPMMHRLGAKTAGRVDLPLVQGDALALPFRARGFGAALAAHVLHLIPDWRRAVAEIRRVVRPGGIFVVSDSGALRRGTGVWNEIMGRFRIEAGLPERFPGLNDAAEADEAFASAGASARDLGGVEQKRTYVPETVIDEMERGFYSFTWTLTQEERSRAAGRVRRWARERYGDVRLPQPHALEVRWRAYDLPA